MYLATQNKSENLATAKNLLINLGFKDFTFCDYSSTFGVSVYFRDENGGKIRVSNHSVTSTARIQSEMLFEFDANQIGLNGISFKDNQKTNRLLMNIYNR